MKKRICKANCFSVTLCFLLACTGCGDSTEEAVGNQAVQIQNAATASPLSEQQGTELSADISSDTMTAEAMTLTKDQLYYRCLNTLEYLNQLSGTVAFLSGYHSPTILQGSFDFDFTEDTYHAVVNHLDVSDEGNCIQTSEYYNHSGEIVSLYDYKGSQQNDYTIEENGVSLKNVVFANACPENPEEVTQSNSETDTVVTSVQELSEEELYATLGQDPTSAHELGACFIPQEMTVGYLEDFENWNIVDTIKFQGRVCAVVQGNAEPSYGDRFGVETFEIIVDQETGIWMQYEGYDADGAVQSYLYTENILFGAEANDVPDFSEEMASGYAYNDFYASLTIETNTTE